MDLVETRTFEQLPPAATAARQDLVAIQSPGGPLHSVTIGSLFAGIQATDIAVATVAELTTDADAIALPTGALALVFADADPALSGYYLKSDATGPGTWQITDIEYGRVLAAVQPLADQAVAAAASADLSATSALVASNLYPDTEAGLAAVAEGGYFAVAGSGDTYATTYRKEGGVAVAKESFPSKAGLENSTGAVATMVEGRFDALASEGGSEEVGYKLPATAAVPRTVEDKLYEVDVFDALTPAMRSSVRDGNGSADTAAAQQAIWNFATGGESMSDAAGGTRLRYRGGRYTSTLGLTNWFRPDNSIVDDRDLRRMNIEGDGSANTELNFAIGAGVKAIDLRGNNNADGRLLGTYTKGLRITQNPINTRLGMGFYLKHIAGHTLEDVKISGFDVNLLCEDVLEFMSYRLHLLGGNIGCRMQFVDWTKPNFIIMRDGAMSGNLKIAGHFKNAANLKIDSLRLEGNGRAEGSGGGRLVDTGLWLDGAPLEGGAWADISNVYAENNNTLADIQISNGGTQGGVINIHGNTFQRTSPTRWANHFIDMFSSATARAQVNIRGNGFKALGSYVAGTAPIWRQQSAPFDVAFEGNHTPTLASEYPVTNNFPVKGLGMFNEAVATLITNTAGVPAIAADRNGNIDSVSFVSPGRVQVNFKRAMRNSNYFVDARPYNAAGYCAVIGGTNLTTSVQIEVRDAAGAPFNNNFNLTIRGDYAAT